MSTLCSVSAKGFDPLTPPHWLTLSVHSSGLSRLISRPHHSCDMLDASVDSGRIFAVCTLGGLDKMVNICCLKGLLCIEDFPRMCWLTG